MKANKKSKQNIFLTLNQISSKSNNIRAETTATTNQHSKLLQYRDYLLSLRKMDLGSLIQQNKNRQKQQCHRKNSPQPINEKYKRAMERKQHQPEAMYTSHKGKQNIKHHNINSSKVKHISLKIDKPKRVKQIEQFQSELKPIENLNKQSHNSFKLVLKNNFEEDDLYCNEDMQDVMKSHRPSTPKLIHMNNLGSNFSKRYHSIHRSSRNRDFSMPSIQQRNMSEQSEQSIDKNVKPCPRSISDGINHRKYNSCNHTTPLHEEKQPEMRQRQKRTSLVGVSLTSRSELKEELNKTFDKEHLISTQDINSYSNDSKSSRVNQKNVLNVKISAFNLRRDLNDYSQKDEKRSDNFSKQRQGQKLCLNVSEIVKRINSRQSKSSMSDRSYRKKHQTSQMTNRSNQSRQLHDQIYSDTIKEKFTKFIQDHSTIPINRISAHHLNQQITNKKSFKYQVKQFRQKHYLMMKLAE